MRGAVSRAGDDDRSVEELLAVVERFVRAGPVADPLTGLTDPGYED